MIPPKYLYSAIGAMALAIVSLLSMWGKDTSNRVTSTQQRVEILEQSRAVHDEELKQIHQDLEEIKEILRANHRY